MSVVYLGWHFEATVINHTADYFAVDFSSLIYELGVNFFNRNVMP